MSICHGAFVRYLPPATDEETHFYDPKPHLKASIGQQVNEILAVPESERNRFRSNGQQLAVKKLSHQNWAQTIVEQVGAI